MGRRDADFELGDGWEAEIFDTVEWKRECDKLGQNVTAAAVPYTGVDSSDLEQSMGYDIQDGEDGVPEVVFGSNPETGNPVPYAGAHWVGGKKGAALDVPPTGERREQKRIPHPTRPAPTTPWKNACDDLGIEWVSNLPNGEES